jgi:hypothetical protein
VSPPVPRFRFPEDSPADTVVSTIIAAATAAFDEPKAEG